MLDANSPLWQERLEAKLDALTKMVERLCAEADEANQRRMNAPPRVRSNGLLDDLPRDERGRLIIR